MKNPRLKSLTLLLLVFSILSIIPLGASFAQAEVPAAFADGNRPKVALVRQLADGEFFARYLSGAQSQAAELGIDLVESNARGDDAVQATNLETAIQQGVDAIIIDHGKTDTLQPLIEEALSKGIKVVTFDLVVNNPDVPEIEQDDLQIGFTLSRYVAVQTGGNANVLYVNVNGFAPLDKRDRIWQDFKWRYPGLNEVAKVGAVSSSTANDTQTRVEAALAENPDINVVVATYDEFAKGAVRAIQQAGKADQISVYGVDIANEDIQLIIAENSPWKATVATDSYNVGRLAVRTAAALIGGEKVDKYLLVEPTLITRDFLLENNVTNIDELVAVLPALGESSLSWYPWFEPLLAANGASFPATIAATGDAGGASVIPADLSPYADVPLPEAFSEGKRPKVALVRQLADGEFFARYLSGAQSQAAELGIDLVESNARGDDAVQATNLETAIQQGVDAIIIDHGKTDTLQPLIEEALSKGIKVVTFDLVVNNPDVPEIEQDDLQIGFTLSRYVAVQTGGNANVLYVNVNGFAPLDKRDRIWQDFKWRYPGLNEVAKVGAVSSSTANDTQTRVEAALAENPDINVVVATYDEFAKGAVRAIQQAGKADEISVYGVDIANEDIQLIIAENSPWKATVATDSYNVGRLAVRTAAALIGGEEVDKYLLVEPTLITRDFLLENNVTNIDELVGVLPSLGESSLSWYPWTYRLLLENQQS
jgi:ABC-type sugar transport system substrate-binding protein